MLQSLWKLGKRHWTSMLQTWKYVSLKTVAQAVVNVRIWEGRSRINIVRQRQGQHLRPFYCPRLQHDMFRGNHHQKQQNNVKTEQQKKRKNNVFLGCFFLPASLLPLCLLRQLWSYWDHTLQGRWVKTKGVTFLKNVERATWEHYIRFHLKRQEGKKKEEW